MISHLGYACINTELSSRPKNKRITTNRTCRKATLDNKSREVQNDLLCSLAEKNTADLIKIINWNEQNQIKFFRISGYKWF